jgi:hypothetical protein
VPAAHRGAWFEAARLHMEQIGVPWCLSSYRGNWGFFDDAGQNQEAYLKFSNFAYDINDTLAGSLGLTPPAKAEYTPVPMTEGFTVFDEEINPLAKVGWWLGDGEPSFFVEDDPFSGQRCMGIFYPGQYNAVDFFFPLYLDLYDLAQEGYKLEFHVRCDDPTGHIQARFEDTNDSFEEHPWRMNYHVDDGVVPFDGAWQLVSVALTDMQDQGAWDPDDRMWYGGGEMLPDWAFVQRLQFVSETAAQPATEIYIDRVRIVSPTGVEDRGGAAPGTFGLSAAYPNPFNASTVISFTLPEKAHAEIDVVNLRGEVVRTLAASGFDPGAHRVTWDGTDGSGRAVPSGVYLARLRAGGEMRVVRTALIR